MEQVIKGGKENGSLAVYLNWWYNCSSTYATNRLVCAFRRCTGWNRVWNNEGVREL